MLHDEDADDSFEHDPDFEFDAPKWLDIAADDVSAPRYAPTAICPVMHARVHGHRLSLGDFRSPRISPL